MTTPSLNQRLRQAAWAEDWPFDATASALGAHQPKLQPSGWWNHWEHIAQTYRALGRVGEHASISLAEGHKALDHLHQWTDRYAPTLTYPPTPLSFARALKEAAYGRDESVLYVMAAYPHPCAQALLSLSDREWGRIQAHGPASASALLAGIRALAEPAAAVESTTVASESSTPAPVANERPRKDRESRDPHADSEERQALAQWMSESLEALGNSGQRMALRREELDRRIKRLKDRGGSDPAQWFRQDLLPVLATLSPDQTQTLLAHWPEHHRFSVGDPVSLVEEKRFWAILRDAPHRETLLTHLLPALVDTESWSFEQRYGMLEPMFGWAQKHEQTFRDRLALWQHWGGRLDDTATVAPAAATEGNDLFLGGGQAKEVSARAWFTDKNNEMWQSVLREFQAPVDATPRRPKM